MLTQALVLAACALGALAQNTTSAANQTSSTPTATVLIGTLTTGLAGSVISANPCDTTYAFTCTDQVQCNGLDVTFTVTEGPTDYQIQYATSTGGAQGIISESCSLSGSSYAVCMQSLSLSANGQSTVTKTTATLSGSSLVYGQFPITAGAEKLASATGSCTATANAAVATGVRGVREMVKVVVVPAAAVAMVAGVFA